MEEEFPNNFPSTRQTSATKLNEVIALIHFFFSPFSSRVGPLIFILMYSADCRNFFFLFLAFVSSDQKLTEKERKIEVDELDNLIGFFTQCFFLSFFSFPPHCSLRALYNFHFIKMRKIFQRRSHSPNYVLLVWRSSEQRRKNHHRVFYKH